MADRPEFKNCPSCGFKNPAEARRCGSCGATVEELRPIESEAKERERRYQQEGFSLPWFGVALLVQGVLTAAILVALPQAIKQLDFEGYYGMSLAIPVWFCGGLLIGLISPGKTFVEPVVAAMFIALPTVFYLYNGFFGMLGPGQTVRTMPWFMYMIMGLTGMMFTLVGSYVGERIQLGPPPKPTS